MQVFCRKTDGNAEMYCCVCGQGFVMFWDRQTAIERAVMRTEIQETLRRQHRTTTGHEAHPANGFAAPEWSSTFQGMAETAPADKVPAWEI